MRPGRGTEPVPRAEPPEPPQGAGGERLDDDQLRRLAALVAVNEAPEPNDLPPRQHSRLVALVRQVRRDRLIDLIARCIALELKRGGGP